MVSENILIKQVYDTLLLKQKKRPILGITGFFFSMSTLEKAEVRMRKKKPVLLYPIQANSLVSTIMHLTYTKIVLLNK